MSDDELVPRSKVDGHIATEVLVKETKTLVHADGNSFEGDSHKDVDIDGEAVPEALADLIWHEASIDVTDKGIKIVPDERGALDDEE